MQDKRLKVIISDFHVGEGHQMGIYNNYDDFYFDDEFVEFLDYYSSGPYESIDVELIINGDFFDLLKVRYEGKFSEHITLQVALAKLKQCIIGHPKVVNALKKFLVQKNHTITYIPGNHDIEFMFPEVGQYFTEIIAPHAKERVKVINDTDTYFLEGGIQVQHGHQFEPANAFNYRKIFITDNVPEPILELPWGSYYMLKVVNGLKDEKPYVDQVKPISLFILHGLLLDFRFTAKFIWMTIYHFFRTQFVHNPFRKNKLFQTLLIVLTSIRFIPDLEGNAQKILKHIVNINTIIMGHNHKFRYRAFENNKLYVNTGTWTRMINLGIDEFGHEIKLTYCVIEYNKDEKPKISLEEWQGTRRPHRKVNF